MGPILGVGERVREGWVGLKPLPKSQKVMSLLCVTGRGLHPGDISPIPLSHSLAASPMLSPYCSCQFAGPWPPLLVEAYSHHTEGGSRASAGVTQGSSVILTFLPLGCFHLPPGDLRIT